MGWERNEDWEIGGDPVVEAGAIELAYYLGMISRDVWEVGTEDAIKSMTGHYRKDHRFWVVQVLKAAEAAGMHSGSRVA